MKLRLFFIIVWATSVLSSDSTAPDYHGPNNEGDKVILWAELFNKLNTILLQIDAINKNFQDLNNRFDDLHKRQEDQELAITKLTENVDFNSKYLNEIRSESNARQEDENHEITKLVKNVDLIVKHLNESRSESNARQKDENHEITKLVKNVDLIVKHMNESRTESNARQEDENHEITKLVKNVDLIVKHLNESRSESNARQNNTIANGSLKDRLLNKNHDWTPILRRRDGSVDFKRNWTDYKYGFGDPNGEFFIGLEKLYVLTTFAAPQELLVIVEDWTNQTRYELYKNFQIGSESEMYRLTVASNSGNAGSRLATGMTFLTPDHVSCSKVGINCDQISQGGWWIRTNYYNYMASICNFAGHLTGPYIQESAAYTSTTGVKWCGRSLKSAEMLTRARS